MYMYNFTKKLVYDSVDNYKSCRQDWLVHKTSPVSNVCHRKCSYQHEKFL